MGKSRQSVKYFLVRAENRILLAKSFSVSIKSQNTYKENCTTILLQFLPLRNGRDVTHNEISYNNFFYNFHLNANQYRKCKFVF